MKIGLDPAGSRWIDYPDIGPHRLNGGNSQRRIQLPSADDVSVSTNTKTTQYVYILNKNRRPIESLMCRSRGFHTAGISNKNRRADRGNGQSVRSWRVLSCWQPVIGSSCSSSSSSSNTRSRVDRVAGPFNLPDNRLIANNFDRKT
jgi:hypothetical protein